MRNPADAHSLHPRVELTFDKDRIKHDRGEFDLVE